MFRDLSYMIFGGEIDPFFQLFVFEPIIIILLSVLAAIITKKTWVMAVVILGLNMIDSALYSAYLYSAEGMGSIIMHTFTLFFSKFFSMFYEFVISFIIAGLPFMHKKFGIA